MKYTKRILSFLCCLCFVCVMTGCAVQEKGDSQDKEKRRELTLWSYYETEMQKKSMDELVEGFNQSQNQYHLTWEYHGPVTEFNKRLAIAITQDQLPDMVIVDNPDMPSYIEMDKFEDITKEIQNFEGFEDYFSSAMDAVESEGRYYGLPFCCNNVALVYNKDILKEENVSVPKNWEELEQAAKNLTRPGQYGFAMSAISGEQGAFQFASFMMSAGDTIEEVGGEGTLKAFRFIRNMAEEGIMSRECVNWSQNDVARIFIAGKCAMMENGPWVFPALDKAGINYGVATFPAEEQYTGILGGEVIGVLKGKDKEGSVAFLEYYSERDIMLNANLLANSLPPREDVAKLFLNVKPEFQVTMSQMKNCISRTSYKGWSKLSELLSEGQYQVITGESSPEELCRNIQKEMEGTQ